MNTMRNPWSRSRGIGGCFSRNVAIAPSRKAEVISSSRTWSQKASVRKWLTTPIELPTQSDTVAMKAPPMWKIGMCSNCRSSGVRQFQASGPTQENACI